MEKQKITFIYAYEGEEWSTPMALANEFKSRSWDVDFVSIGSNRTGQYHDRNLREWLETNPSTDITLFMDWGRFDSNFLDKEELPNSFWIQESGDDPQNFTRNSPKSHKFHFTFTPDYNCYSKYKDMGINVEWIPHFADTRVQFPIQKDPEYVGVTSRGLGGSQFLDYLTEWGKGAIGNKNGMDYKEHTQFLNSGLMVIQNSRWGEITRRLFEGMACKKLVLTDRLDEMRNLHGLFEEGKEIILYDDLTDCINKINYYHENVEEREQIAEQGYNKVLQNFTQVQVVDKLIEKYTEWKNSR